MYFPYINQIVFSSKPQPSIGYEINLNSKLSNKNDKICHFKFYFIKFGKMLSRAAEILQHEAVLV